MSPRLWLEIEVSDILQDMHSFEVSWGRSPDQLFIIILIQTYNFLPDLWIHPKDRYYNGQLNNVLCIQIRSFMDALFQDWL